MKESIIAPSILSSNFGRLTEEVNSVMNAGADWIHFDVMDNHYVPNLTIGPLVCESLRKDGIKDFIDVHLMIKPVDKLAESFVKAGADLISFHPEATSNVSKTIAKIREMSCKVGLAINPETPADILKDYLMDIDLVLLMSVNPGFGGQKFIVEVLEKIKSVRSMIDACDNEIYLEVDGGINMDTIQSVANAGANVFVAGSAIFGSDNYANTIKHFREKIS